MYGNSMANGGHYLRACLCAVPPVSWSPIRAVPTRGAPGADANLLRHG